MVHASRGIPIADSVIAMYRRAVRGATAFHGDLLPPKHVVAARQMLLRQVLDDQGGKLLAGINEVIRELGYATKLNFLEVETLQKIPIAVFVERRGTRLQKQG